MRIRLAYGQQGLFITLPEECTTVIEPLFSPGLPNEAEALHQALAAPLGTVPLHDVVSSRDTIAIVIPDVTRAMPSSRVLPVLLQHLAHVPPAQITILIATGTHRPATHSELCQMLGDSIVARYQIENHLGYATDQLIEVGRTPSGIPVKLNRLYVQATKRIVCGFIEPHFFAGFSGGPKMVCPGVAAAETIFRLHSAPLIASPHATWGVVEGNPIQEEIRYAADLLPPDFCLSVEII
ncbi:MAG: lactate racemase domain-containing protein, partial [Chloroflexi bacterium]|nr:lactate racemase domain-containing protein [Chloroflexota bacterium]